MNSNSFWNGTTSRIIWSHHLSICVMKRALLTWVVSNSSKPGRILIFACSLPTGNIGMWWTDLQSTQNGTFGLQSLLQDTSRGKSFKTPDHHPEGRLFQSFASYSRIHVSWLFPKARTLPLLTTFLSGKYWKCPGFAVSLNNLKLIPPA